MTDQVIFGRKPIREHLGRDIGEKVKHNFRSAWYFNKWYEKLILVGLCALGLWKIIGFFI